MGNRGASEGLLIYFSPPTPLFPLWGLGKEIYRRRTGDKEASVDRKEGEKTSFKVCRHHLIHFLAATRKKKEEEEGSFSSFCSGKKWGSLGSVREEEEGREREESKSIRLLFLGEDGVGMGRIQQIFYLQEHYAAKGAEGVHGTVVFSR